MCSAFCPWLLLTACTHILLYVPSHCFVVTVYCLHACLPQGVSCCKVGPITSCPLGRKPNLADADLEAARDVHVNAVLLSHAKNPSVMIVAGGAHCGVYRIPRLHWGRHATQLTHCKPKICGWEQAVLVMHLACQHPGRSWYPGLRAPARSLGAARESVQRMASALGLTPCKHFPPISPARAGSDSPATMWTNSSMRPMAADWRGILSVGSS